MQKAMVEDVVCDGGGFGGGSGGLFCGVLCGLPWLREWFVAVRLLQRNGETGCIQVHGL
jgi:hypothetical protein